MSKPSKTQPASVASRGQTLHTAAAGGAVEGFLSGDASSDAILPTIVDLINKPTPAYGLKPGSVGGPSSQVTKLVENVTDSARSAEGKPVGFSDSPVQDDQEMCDNPSAASAVAAAYKDSEGAHVSVMEDSDGPQDVANPTNMQRAEQLVNLGHVKEENDGVKRSAAHPAADRASKRMRISLQVWVQRCQLPEHDVSVWVSCLHVV